MKIVPLNCPNCGKRLEIGENKEQVACGTCGSQLFVDRSGGTISLELAKSLGAISTGAAQAAAELALVRLEKELRSVSFKVIDLEIVAESGHEYYKEQEIMNETVFTSAEAQLKELKAKQEWISSDIFPVIPGVILAIVIVIIYVNFGQKIAFFAIPVAGILVFITYLVYATHESSVNTRKSKLEEQIRRHHLMVKWREERSQANEKLPEVRALVTRIEAEIARNKKIVSLKH